jgi:predicted transcriptional regulator of viral defense system
MEDAVAIVPDSRAKGQRDPDRTIAALAANQHGLVSRAQLLRLGLGRREVQYRVETGRLLPVRRGVYAAGHRPRSAPARWMAAVLAVGDDAVLSHRSAAALWGLTRQDPVRVDITVPRALRRTAGIALHRTAVARDEVRRRDGVPLTSIPRTLLDLAAVLDRHRLRRVVEQAETLRLADHASLDDLLRRHPRRAGAPALRAILAEGLTGAGVSRSELEERFQAFLDARALPRPRQNAPVRTPTRTFEADFVWTKERVIAELDGHAFHSHREAFERDRLRDRSLQAAGWRVVRVTWRQLGRDPKALAADLKRLLASD